MELAPFEPNEYRKRVLAAVEKRGGPQTSDAFELYDIPLDSAEDLSDSVVAERLSEVWAFWQRQRDHPKYRVLVAALLAAHHTNSEELGDSDSRAELAERVRRQRAGQDAARYEIFDAALAALVARHGGIPSDKLSQLEHVGRESGLSDAEVATRLRRHRVIDPAAKPATPPVGDLVPEQRRRQIRALLDELGRIWESPPPATLFVLLGCDSDTDDAEVAARAAAWRARARELPSDRLRTVIDELLVHVGDLLETDSAIREAYLDGVATDMMDKLRPRVRAAVLVEDRLTADDHAHLVNEAAELGLDARRATRVLAALAAEFGVPVDMAPPTAARRDEPASRPNGPPSPQPTGKPPWSVPLRAARAALRAGRPVEARALAEEARQYAMPDRQPSIAAVADEIEAVLADARLRWRAASSALQAHRYAEAAEHLEQLTRVAADVPDPERVVDIEQALVEARAAVEEADRLVAAATAGPEASRVAGLMAALQACAQHPGALAALAALPLAGPARISAQRSAGGDVTVRWDPAPDAGVTYRITRLEPDGTWRTVGRTATTSMDDGGAPPGPGTPVYAVVALQAGRSSSVVRSDAAPTPPSRPVGGSGATTPPTIRYQRGPRDKSTRPSAPVHTDAPTADVPAPREVRAERVADGSVVVSWASSAGSADIEYQVTRRTPDGDWRVVGRTRATSMEDGGAPDGPLPEYGVVARAGGVASERVVSSSGS